MTQNRPTHATVGGRAYLALRNLARRQDRNTDELLRFYALEGFLARLAVSPHAASLVLKGGVLLAAYDARRPTRDVDLHARALSNDTDIVKELVCGIAAIEHTDGLLFHPDTSKSTVIREDDLYSGVRVTMNATLSTARLDFHVDVSVGDPIWPAPQPITIPRMLDGEITLQGYPLHMVLAEKVITAVQRGSANTRWRDFADIYTLTRCHDMNSTDLHRALTEVAHYRDVKLTSLSETLGLFGDQQQISWLRWRRGQHLDQHLPESFNELLQTVYDFADPILTVTPKESTWISANLQWQS